MTPHATSKVRSVADLERVVTLGFRGEALASIAAVAELEIASAADDIGLAHALRVGLDTPAIVTETPRARGTTVIVRDLFATVPARRALLRSARVEAGSILAVVRAYALAHSATRFTVVGDGFVLLQASGSDCTEVVAAIYGSDVARALLPFGPVRVGDATIVGMVASRAFHTTTRDQVSLVVNGRPVANRALLSALEAGYRPLLRKGRHPLLIAELTVPPGQVDANIHPSKAEVLLRDEQALAAALREAVHATLRQAPLNALASASDVSPGQFARPMALRFPPRRIRRATRITEQGRSYTTDADEAVLDPGEWQPLAQFDDTLILARTAGGHLLLIDQHRAHERILYERLLQRRHALSKATDGHTAAPSRNRRRCSCSRCWWNSRHFRRVSSNLAWMSCAHWGWIASRLVAASSWCGPCHTCPAWRTMPLPSPLPLPKMPQPIAMTGWMRSVSRWHAVLPSGADNRLRQKSSGRCWPIYVAFRSWRRVRMAARCCYATLISDWRAPSSGKLCAPDWTYRG